MRVRAHGEGIEGRPIIAGSGSVRKRTRSHRRARASEGYLPSPRMAAGAQKTQDDGTTKDAYHDDDDDDDQEGMDGEAEGDEEEDAVLVYNRQSRTTLALLQTFHAQTRFWLSHLAALLPPPSTADDNTREGSLIDLDAPAGEEVVVQLAPRDVLELELGPLSSLDARFVEWLVEEYAGGGAGVRVCVRRGWRDLLGLVLAVCGSTPSSSYHRHHRG